MCPMNWANIVSNPPPEECVCMAGYLSARPCRETFGNMRSVFGHVMSEELYEAGKRCDSHDQESYKLRNEVGSREGQGRVKSFVVCTV